MVRWRGPISRTRATGKRCIPAHVKRAVWERDGGRCTFVSPTGRRCPARTLLEFDHLDPVALGGDATAEKVTLKCRAHNQYAAECAFGSEFMRHKREEARRARKARAAAARQTAEAREPAAAAAEKAKELDVVPALRNLGFRADEARRAAAHCDKTLPDEPLEERLRTALRFLSPPAAAGAPLRTAWRPRRDSRTRAARALAIAALPPRRSACHVALRPHHQMRARLSLSSSADHTRAATWSDGSAASTTTKRSASRAASSR